MAFNGSPRLNPTPNRNRQKGFKVEARPGTIAVKGACHFMKQLIGLVAVLGILALGLAYVASQGDADRDVPGRTTNAGKNKLGD